MHIMDQTDYLTLAFLLFNCFPHGIRAAFETFTTPLGHSYLLSNSSTTFLAASSDCATQGSTMATFDNILFQDVIDFLRANSPMYDGYQIWIPVTKISTWPRQYFFTGGDEVAADKWYSNEPDFNCGSTCCYRIALDTSVGQHRLRDHFCTQTYHYICVDSSTTTASTSTITTSTSTSTLSTALTTETISTTAETAPSTSTTAPTTSTSLDSTTPGASTTVETSAATTSITSETTPSTTSTKAETTSVTTSITSATTSPTTSTNVALTLSTVTSFESPKLPLSTGEQMSILYIGFIVGGSLVISCCCSTTWLVIFRTHRRFKIKATDEEALEHPQSDEGDSDFDCSTDED